MNLENKIFDLIENQGGLASSDTRMTFNNDSFPFQAMYSGPNVSNGHVLVASHEGSLNMIYHALTSEGVFVAGKADVSFTNTEKGPLTMQLNWQWLTGDLSSGVSMWSEVVT